MGLKQISPDADISRARFNVLEMIALPVGLPKLRAILAGLANQAQSRSPISPHQP